MTKPKSKSRTRNPSWEANLGHREGLRITRLKSRINARREGEGPGDGSEGARGRARPTPRRRQEWLAERGKPRATMNAVPASAKMQQEPRHHAERHSAEYAGKHEGVIRAHSRTATPDLTPTANHDSSSPTTSPNNNTAPALRDIVHIPGGKNPLRPGSGDGCSAYPRHGLKRGRRCDRARSAVSTWISSARATGACLVWRL
jgi:hypothetical protein